MRGSRSLAVSCVLALAVLPLVAAFADQPFYIDLFLRIMIFAIAAISLDLILGYGGLVSLGHAVYLGIGGYSVAILNYYGVQSGFAHFGTALAVSAGAAFLIGLVSLRTSGVYFIMVTLAFAQMVYFLGISINTFGGDDGITVPARSSFGLFTLDDTFTLYYFTLIFLALFLVAGFRITRSRFGRVIIGSRINDKRMVALGFPTFRYRLAAFVIAGAVCGFAGALLANLSLFVSPAIMHWFRSGELLVMVILGGAGTLAGPLLGAITYLLLEHVVSGWTSHWQFVLGCVVLVMALCLTRGIVGVFRFAGKQP